MARFKKILLTLSFVIPFLLASCAGDPPKTTPVHLRAGTEQVKSGNAFYQRGCYSRALEHYFRAHELYAAADQPEGVAMSMNNIGSAYRALGDSRSALSFFDQAAGFYRRADDGTGLRQVLSNRAAALIDLGDLAGANLLLEEAGRVQAGQSDKPFIPVLMNRGILLTKMGKYGEAEQALKEALTLSGSGTPAEQAPVYFAMGNLMAETKRYPEAVGQFSAALKADRASGFYKGIADDLAALGRASRALGKNAEAADYFDRSLKIYSLLGLKREQEEAAGLLKKACSDSGVKCPGGVTDFFVDRWTAGKRLENPCED